jgi:hypothetical protein
MGKRTRNIRYFWCEWFIRKFGYSGIIGINGNIRFIGKYWIKWIIRINGNLRFIWKYWIKWIIW